MSGVISSTSTYHFLENNVGKPWPRDSPREKNQRVSNLAIMVAVAPSCWNHSNSLSGSLKSLPSFGYRKTRGMAQYQLLFTVTFPLFFLKKSMELLH